MVEDVKVKTEQYNPALEMNRLDDDKTMLYCDVLHKLYAAMCRYKANNFLRDTPKGVQADMFNYVTSNFAYVTIIRSKDIKYIVQGAPILMCIDRNSQEICLADIRVETRKGEVTLDYVNSLLKSYSCMDAGIQLINMTPHPVVVGNVTLPSKGLVRMEEKFTSLGQMHGVPIGRLQYGKVLGLPDPSPGVFYIVSGIVARNVKYRSDLLTVGERCFNRNGQVVSCRYLQQLVL